MHKLTALFSTALIGAVLLAAPASADGRGRDRARWITGWGTSQQGLGTTAITNATVRMIARVSIPGEAVRVRLDNTFGTAPLTIGRATVGQRIQNPILARGSNRPVTFRGAASVTIPPGGSVTSDPVRLTVFARQDLAVSLHIPGAAVLPSQHNGARVTSYYSADGAGDTTADELGAALTNVTTSMWWLKSIDVLTDDSSGAIVAFGDSITDGTCTTLDAHDRWEDWVSVRLDLQSESSGRGRFGHWRGGNRDELKAIVNEGIGGNTVTRETNPPPNSPPGVDRLERDVLSHHGVTHVVLFMGTNDIRRDVTAEQLIAGYRDIIRRVRAAGKEIIGVTIIPRHNRPPEPGNSGWDDAKTAIRNQVNDWIRHEARFDGVIDFDRVVADPANPDLIYPPFDCGDGIHPSPIGYYMMGKAVDLDLLGDRGGR
jgi:lysophospholipase L1-like esterase